MRFLKSAACVSAALAFTACGVNPVTGKRELQFVSEAQEIQIGEQNYAPARQAEGGPVEVMPELTTYVAAVGGRLAKVADRQLPYEFTVLNNSVPNAWALPGGKIAVNRGLLTELHNEAELAAVLGHEIVHAAARHGAKAQERGTLMQAGLAVAQIGATVGGVDSDVAGIAVSGAGIGLQMAQMKYGRDQELEADHFGMKYMKAAGYDPTAAVTLQETFVRITQEKGKEQGFFERMFASHPPSTERVEKNKEMLATLGAGGELGADTYREHIAALLKAKPAYDKFDAATAAMNKKDYAAAKSLATEAHKLLPTEGRFLELLGEVEVEQKHYPEALPYFEQAIQYNPKYFGSYLGGGIAQYHLGDKAKAQDWLKRSQDLLPTAPAAYYLGKFAQERGDTAVALAQFRSAADSQSSYGQLAAKEFVTLDLPEHPEQYVAAAARVDESGRIVVVVQNRAPLALSDIRLTPVLVDAAGRVAQSGTTLRVPGSVNAGEQIVLHAGLGSLTAAEFNALRFRIDGAKVAE